MVYVLVHNDNDGLYAGYCAWKYHRDLALYSPEYLKIQKVQYGKPFPLDVDTLTKDDEVYILDFSYRPEILDPVYAKVKKLVVLDHHETAKEYLEGCPYAHFDMTKSGALLAWEYFFPGVEPTMTCKLINDRDLWLWKYGKQAAYLHEWILYDRFDMDWQKWFRLDTCQVAFDDAIKNGEPLYELILGQMNAFMGNPDNYQLTEAYLTQLPETHKRKVKFILYNGNYTSISELAQHFYTKYPDHITIDYRVRKKIVTFSCRSPDKTMFNVEQFAQSKGGGGHPKAASFSMPREEAFAYIESLYNGTAV